MQFPLTRSLQILSSFTSKSTSRPALACVNIQKNYAQATDSYSLMRITDLSVTPTTDTELNIDLQNIKMKLPKDNTPVTMEVRTESDQFPDADMIIGGAEEKPALATVTLNAEYLLNICKAIKELTIKNKHHNIIIEMRSNSDPVVLKAKTEKGADVLALLMPIRS